MINKRKPCITIGIYIAQINNTKKKSGNVPSASDIGIKSQILASIIITRKDMGTERTKIAMMSKIEGWFAFASW
jgi:hypothetical protein